MVCMDSTIQQEGFRHIIVRASLHLFPLDWAAAALRPFVDGSVSNSGASWICADAVRKEHDERERQVSGVLDLGRRVQVIVPAFRERKQSCFLYLGAWILAVGAALLTFFRYPSMARAEPTLVGTAFGHCGSPDRSAAGKKVGVAVPGGRPRGARPFCRRASGPGLPVRAEA